MKKKWKLSAVLLVVVLVGALFAGCGSGDTTIKMATKPMTEQYILGSMMKLIQAGYRPDGRTYRRRWRRHLQHPASYGKGRL